MKPLLKRLGGELWLVIKIIIALAMLRYGIASWFNLPIIDDFNSRLLGQLLVVAGLYILVNAFTALRLKEEATKKKEGN